ncbi:MAG: LLM class flavin-dependent oxidoreductase [Chloroflexi bacterium]|nr:LLM class flavin-dependent oxidoreductase [Chloroflexota bacterium]
MRFSLRVNNDLPADMYARLADAAECAGFDQFWVSNDLFLRSVWVLLTSAAQATRRIRIGTCIVNPYTMHPAEIAMAAAALNELSNGRFLLGLSSGADDFLAWIGIRAERPVSAVAETMAALRRVWRGEREHPTGQFAPLQHWSGDAYLRFQAQSIPIYVGAMSPRMLRLIGSDADGGLPLLFPPEHFVEAMQHIGDGAARAGRALSNVDVAACIWCSISADRRAAENVMREKIAYYGHAFSPLILSRLGLTRADFDPIQGALRTRSLAAAAELVTPRMLQIGVVGTSRDLLPRLEQLVARGATHLSFGPPLGPDLFEAINILGREVLPHFK